MSYGCGRMDKTQNIAYNATVVFQTKKAAVELHDDAGTLIDAGVVRYYDPVVGSAYCDFGKTSGGKVSKELLPVNYRVNMEYNFSREEKGQNITANPVVVFQTGKLHSYSGACTYYFEPVFLGFGGVWHTVTQDMQLLPGTRNFRFNGGTADTLFAILAGSVNHIR